MAGETPYDHEAFYDEEIAPVLLDLAHKCAARDVPFLALTQYKRVEGGRAEFGETAVRLDLSPALTAASSARHETSPTPHVHGVALLFRPGMREAS